MKLSIFRALAKINKVILPSYKDKDLTMLTKKDKLINKYERDIRRKVITHLTVQGNESIAAGLVLSTVIVDKVICL